MRTLHAAPLLRRTLDEAPTADAAVLVDGDRIVAIGPTDELVRAYPGVRMRRWPGTLGPALRHDGPLPPPPPRANGCTRCSGSGSARCSPRS